MNIRIGFGYDVHRFVAEQKLILGGVEIPYEYGLDGHSDADVLSHAITDALLGSLALGDIGTHFPDTDPAFKNANSIVLLKESYNLILDQGFTINNIDATVVAERPKLLPFIREITSSLSVALNLPDNCVSIKATTNEMMGFLGRKEGMAAYAVVMIQSR